MTRDDLLRAALLLDAAAAETDELHWIAPLCLMKAQALGIAGDAARADGDAAADALAGCERVARAVRAHEPIPPDAPRRILFALFECACAPVDAGRPDELREQCARHAGLVRTCREARTLFGRAWRRCPGDVRREEEVAFDARQRGLERAFIQLLRACDSAIRADGVHQRVVRVRAVQRALDRLREPEARPQIAEDEAET